MKSKQIDWLNLVCIATYLHDVLGYLEWGCDVYELIILYYLRALAKFYIEYRQLSPSPTIYFTWGKELQFRCTLGACFLIFILYLQNTDF